MPTREDYRELLNTLLAFLLLTAATVAVLWLLT